MVSDTDPARPFISCSCGLFRAEQTPALLSLVDARVGPSSGHACWGVCSRDHHEEDLWEPLKPPGASYAPNSHHSTSGAQAHLAEPCTAQAMQTTWACPAVQGRDSRRAGSGPRAGAGQQAWELGGSCGSSVPSKTHTMRGPSRGDRLQGDKSLGLCPMHDQCLYLRRLFMTKGVSGSMSPTADPCRCPRLPWASRPPAPSQGNVCGV